MPLCERRIELESGDTLTVALHLPGSGGRGDLIVQVSDRDESMFPAAALTVAEAGQLREALRELCEVAGDDRR